MYRLFIIFLLTILPITLYAETTCAEIDGSGIVLRVIVADSVEWCHARLGGTWVNTTGKRYPGVGWRWDGEDFIPPQPYPSWTWDGSQWVAPVPMPEEGSWTWDEAEGEWAEVTE